MDPLPVRYRIGGRPHISVTQVLGLAGRIDSTWFTPEAAERGSCVHRWTEQLDRGEDPQPLPDDWMGYAEAYVAFLHTVKPVWAPDGIERAVCRSDWGLAGRIDRVALDVHGRPGIVDIKTGGKSPWHTHQLSAYNAMLPTGCRWTVHLSREGKYQLVRHDDVTAYRQFFYDLARVRGTVTAVGDFWIPAAAAAVGRE